MSMRKKRNKHVKSFLLARSKLNNIEKIVSKAVADAEITDEAFGLVSNELENHFKMKENIRIKKNQRGDIEKS